MNKSEGFLNMCLRVAKPFPEWTEITDWFRHEDGRVPRLSKHYKLVAGIGCMLRRKKHRLYISLMPGRSAVIQKHTQQFITPPHGDF